MNRLDLKDVLDAQSPVITGKITKVEKGFGFIEGDNGVDYFFHQSDIRKDSRQFRAFSIGDAITFRAGTSEKGPKAFDMFVEPLSITASV